MDRVLRKCAMALCLAVPVFGATAVVAPVLQAGAQEFPDPADFTDPETGEFDTDAYLAALNATNESGGAAGSGAGSGALPRTGSDTESAVAAGLALIVVGGVLAERRRQSIKPAKHLV